MDPFGRALGDFMFEIEKLSHEMDKEDATGWLVVCVDDAAVARGEEDCVMGCYGPFDSPEEALVEAGIHDKEIAEMLEHNPDEHGWHHLIKPMYPPTQGGKSDARW